jgi:hypothetical protein
MASGAIRKAAVVRRAMVAAAMAVVVASSAPKLLHPAYLLASGSVSPRGLSRALPAGSTRVARAGLAKADVVSRDFWATCRRPILLLRRFRSPHQARVLMRLV